MDLPTATNGNRAQPSILEQEWEYQKLSHATRLDSLPYTTPSRLDLDFCSIWQSAVSWL